MKIAIQDPNYSALARLPDGSRITSAAARAKGYTVQAAPSRMTEAGTENAQKAYAAAIMALPEAQERPLTAERIGSAYTAKSLPVAKAASLLRGLPSEIDEMRERIEARAVAREASIENPRIKRRMELRIAALSLTASFDDAARKERTQLNMALTTASEMKISMRAAMGRLNIDPARFI